MGAKGLTVAPLRNRFHFMPLWRALLALPPTTTNNLVVGWASPTSPTMRLPALSLILLWLIYAVFGWNFASTTSRLLFWALAACCIILVALVFTAPSSMVRRVVMGVIRSDSRALMSVIILAFAVVVAGTWFAYFTRVLVLLAAGALTRIELQRLDYGEWPAFAVIGVVSLWGFAMGLGLYHYFMVVAASAGVGAIA